MEQSKNDHAQKKSACQDDVECVGMELVYKKVPGCIQYIERNARYEFKWTNGWLENPFKAFIWENGAHRSIYAYGDKIMLQNKFGAYEVYNYRCKLSVPDGDVLDLEMKPGKLGRF